MQKEERRKYERYSLEDACIINHNTTVGTIINISMGGLSCGCLDLGNCRVNIATLINIYCKMFNIQAENLYMKVLGSEVFPGQFSKNIRFRVCRGKFCRLDNPQQQQLTNILIRSSVDT